MPSCAYRKCNLKGIVPEGKLYCSDECYAADYGAKREEIAGKPLTEGNLEKLKALVDALERGGHSSKPEHLVTASPLVVKDLWKDNQQLFSLRTNVVLSRGGTKSVHMKVPADGNGGVKVLLMTYLAARVPVGKTQEGLKSLARVLDALSAEGALLGYLSPPSSIELVHPDSQWSDLLPPKSPFKLPAIHNAVFAFVFTDLPEQEVKRRFPLWVTKEGSVGAVLPEEELQ